MTLNDTLERLNALAGNHHDSFLSRLWARLRQDFVTDPDHAHDDFAKWAVEHVDSKILRLATEDSLAAEMEALNRESKRRYGNLLRHFNIPLSVYLLLFGSDIANSRTCIDCVRKLQKLHPHVQLLHLYDTYKSQPAVNNKWEVGDVFRMLAAITVYDLNITEQSRAKKAESKAASVSASRNQQSPAPPCDKTRDEMPQARAVNGGERSSPDRLRDNDAEPESPEQGRRETAGNGPDPASPTAMAMESSSFRLSPESEMHESIIRTKDQRLSRPRTNTTTSGEGRCSNAFIDGGFCVDAATSNDESDVDINIDVAVNKELRFYADHASNASSPSPQNSPPLFNHRSQSPVLPSMRRYRQTSPSPVLGNPRLSDITEESVNWEASPSTKPLPPPPPPPPPPPLSVSDDGSVHIEVGTLTQSKSQSDDVSSLVPLSANVGVRRGLKRTSDEVAPPPPPSDSSQILVAPAKKAKVQTPCQQLPVTPEVPKMPRTSRPRRLDLQLVFHSRDTLGGTEWLNDVVISTMAHSLASEKVGIVDSLTLAAKQQTERGRLSLQPTMSKDRVLIFLNHNSNHWVLFSWERDSRLLQEFNSLPSGSNACTGDAIVPGFLRWVYKEPNLPIHFRKVECPRQQNGWDCGVYALRFAEHVALKEKNMPEHVDGERERFCLRQHLLTSRQRALRPGELMHTDPSLEKRVQCVKNLRMRLRQINQVRQGFMGDDNLGDSSSQAIMSQVADNESLRAHQLGLVAVILDFNARHTDAVGAALRAEEEVNRAVEDENRVKLVRDAMNDFKDASSNMRFPSSSSQQVRERLVTNLNVIGQLMQLVDGDLAALPDADDEETRDLRRLVGSKYLECSTMLVVLDYAVKKFREKRLDWKKKVDNDCDAIKTLSYSAMGITR